MKTVSLLFLFLGASILHGQGGGLPVMVVLDPFTVLAVDAAGATIKSSVEYQNQLHEDRIKVATLLNRSLGDWRKAEPAASSRRLRAPTLAKDHLAATRHKITWDNRLTQPDAVQTLSGENVPIAPEDLAEPAKLDVVGLATRDSLIALAREIEATQREAAATYSAMTGRGLPQQKYEKLRGKMQALDLHLEELQSQQRMALELLQAQATVSDGRELRDGAISSLVQEANHKENVSALSTMKFDEFSWR